MPGFFGVGKKKKSSEGKDKRVLLLGLDGAGTTVLLYFWKLGEAPTTIPTIGFNVETIPTRGRELTVWDVGGQDKLRPLWRHYVDGTHALIYTVDASAPDRFDEAMRELATILDAFSEPVPVLIAANKTDLPATAERDRALTALQNEVRKVEAAKGDKMVDGEALIYPISARTGAGCDELLDAASDACSGKRQRTKKAAATTSAKKSSGNSDDDG